MRRPIHEEAPVSRSSSAPSPRTCAIILCFGGLIGCAQHVSAPVPAAHGSSVPRETPAPSSTAPSAHAPANELASAAPAATGTAPSAAAAVGKPLATVSHVDSPSPTQDRWSVEWVTGDTIRVDSISAITIEANEIRCPHIVQSQGNPVPKNMGFRGLEGDLIEGKSLVAHHISARLIECTEITASKVRRVKTPYRWPGADPKANPVRNRAVAADGSRSSDGLVESERRTR
jgi:hypothetical protein